MPGWKALAITAPTPRHRGPGLFQQADAAERRLAVGEEIVDEQHAVAGVDELRLERELVAGVLGEGKDLRLDDALLQDAGLGLFEDDHRHIQRLRGHHRRGDARGLDGGHAGDAVILEEAGKLRAHFAHKVHIHLVVQKGIHQQKHPPRGRAHRAVSVPPTAASVSRPFRLLSSILQHLRAFFKAGSEKTPTPAQCQGGRLAPFTARGRRHWHTRGRQCPVLSPRVRIWRSARG